MINRRNLLKIGAISRFKQLKENEKNGMMAVELVFLEPVSGIPCFSGGKQGIWEAHIPVNS